MKHFYTALFILLGLTGTTSSNDATIYQVPSHDFPDIVAAIDFINEHAPFTQEVIFEVDGDQGFSMPGQIIRGSGSSAAPVIIRWNGEGQKPVLNFNGSNEDEEAAIVFKGVSHITIDGLNIQNPDGQLEYGIVITDYNEYTGSQFNTIKNTHISLSHTNDYPTQGIRVISMHEQIEPKGSNSYNNFINNHISNVTIAYYFNSNTGDPFLMDTGNTLDVEDDGQHIMENLILCGVYLINQNGAIVNGTKIINLHRPDDGTNLAPAAISTTGTLPQDNLTQPFIISNNRIINHKSETTSIFGMYLNQRNAEYKVSGNILHDLSSEGNGNIYASGIFVFGTNITANIYNNMLSGISAPLSGLSSAAATRGIDVRAFQHVNIYYNSVLLDYSAANENHRSAALNIHNTNNTVDIRNNIFINKTQVPSEENGIVAAIHKNTASINNIEITSDNNIYYTGTIAPNRFVFYGHHSSEPFADQTLEEYQERAENFERNSLSEPVAFLANDNLHVDPFADGPVRGNAQVIGTPLDITTDIFGTLRDEMTPDIGAFELPDITPENAINPKPENLQENILKEIQKLQWQYISNPYHVDPAGFHVYFGNESSLSGNNHLGWVEFSEEQSEYSISISHENLKGNTEYFWKVIPSTSEIEGNDAEGIILWSFKTEDDTRISDDVIKDVKVYPNPANDILNVRTGQPVFIELVNMDGKVLRRINAHGTHTSLSVSGIAPGFYILKIRTDNSSESRIIQLIR